MAAESKYQLKIRKQLESEGWLVVRLITATTTISQTGAPDLLALKPKGACFDVQFIEVKAKNGKTSKIQDFHIKKLKEMGFNVDVMHSP